MEVQSIVLESNDRTPLQEELVAEINRLRFDLLETKVSVKFLDEFSGFIFEGIKIPPASKGAQLEIPYFLALTLEELKVIEPVVLDFQQSLQELTVAVRNEVRSGKLQPLPRFFNLLVKDLVVPDELPESEFGTVDYKRKEAKFHQLIQGRVAKIMKLADGSRTDSRKLNLTASEQMLFEKILQLVQAWKAEFMQKK